jgi:hypothetical protein
MVGRLLAQSAQLLQRRMGPYHPGQRIAVGDGKSKSIIIIMFYLSKISNNILIYTLVIKMKTNAFMKCPMNDGNML